MLTTPITKEEAERRLEQAHPNKFTLLDLSYGDRKNFVELKCNDCGDIITLQIDKILLRKHPCLTCKKQYFKAHNTLEEEQIRKEIEDTFPNKFDLSKMNYKGRHYKVTIICKDCGHEFPTSTGKFLNNKFPCSNCRRLELEEDLKNELIEKCSRELDFSKYRYEAFNSPVTLIVKETGEEIVATPKSLKSQKDPSVPKVTLTTETLKKEVEAKFPNKFDFSKLDFKQHRKPFTLICRDCGGELTISYSNFKRRLIPCQTCRDKEPPRDIKVLQAWCDKYNPDITVLKIVSKEDEPLEVDVTCSNPKHDPYRRFWSNFVKMGNCPYCSNSDLMTKSDVREWFETCSKGYTLLDSYRTDGHLKILVSCPNPDHKPYEAHQGYFETSRGCYLCNGGSSISEITTRDFLLKKGEEFKEEKTFKGLKYKKLLRIDFYLPRLNLAIELHGKQHYESIDFFGGESEFKLRQKRDKIKLKFCKENKIPILIIPYWEFDNAEKILEEYLNIGKSEFLVK